MAQRTPDYGGLTSLRLLLVLHDFYNLPKIGISP